MTDDPPEEASRTAMLVAAYRARATAEDPPICDDRWAAALAGDEGPKLADALDAVVPHMQLWVALRTAHLDAAVSRLSGTASQAVVLGAGFDTRAERLARPGLRFFEVDTAASQAEKRRRISALPGYPTDAATYVSCDFEREDFLDRLVAAGFDAGAPAIVLWEGVSYYLTEPAVRATLRRVASGMHPQSTVLFDFVGKKLIERRTRSPEDQGMLDLVSSVGEPMVWGTNDVLPLLYEEGFRRVRVDSFDEIALHFTGTYDRDRRFRFQHLAEASVEAP